MPGHIAPARGHGTGQARGEEPMKKLWRLGLGVALVLTWGSGAGHASELYKALLTRQQPQALASTANACIPCTPMTPLGFGGYYSCGATAWVRTRNGCFVTSMSQVPPITKNTCHTATCWQNVAFPIWGMFG